MRGPGGHALVQGECPTFLVVLSMQVRGVHINIYQVYISAGFVLYLDRVAVDDLYAEKGGCLAAPGFWFADMWSWALGVLTPRGMFSMDP